MRATPALQRPAFVTPGDGSASVWRFKRPSPLSKTPRHDPFWAIGLLTVLNFHFRPFHLRLRYTSTEGAMGLGGPYSPISDLV